MEKQEDTILISAPTKAGEAFIRQLLLREIPFAVLVNNPAERERAGRLGCKDVIMIDTRDEQTWVLPERPIGKVFLFENSLNLCCRYLRICRTWTSASIYVITNSGNPRLIYRGLGADVVLHTNHDRVDFLIAALLD